MKWSAVSFDLFQTLVDVDQRIPAIWKRILKEDYTDEKAAHYGREIMKEFSPIFRAASEQPQFFKLERLYTQGFSVLFQKHSLPYDPAEASLAILTEHANAPFYADVPGALEQLTKALPLYLSSDADHIMADRLIPKIPVQRAFLSEDIKAYKRNPSGAFFQFVLDQVGIEPEKILHVGDSAADILGAERAGMRSCLIDRDGRGIPGDCRPDYMIRSFRELLEIVR